MKRLLLLGMFAILMACGGVKKTQEALNTGNYGSAINKALKNLAQKQDEKRKSALYRYA